MFRTSADDFSVRLLVDWAKRSNRVAGAAGDHGILLKDTYEEDTEVIMQDKLYEIEELVEEEKPKE